LHNVELMGATPTIYARSRDRRRADTSNIFLRQDCGYPCTRQHSAAWGLDSLDSLDNLKPVDLLSLHILVQTFSCLAARIGGSKGELPVVQFRRKQFFDLRDHSVSSES
jgi:hypothetical protein